MAAKKQQTHAKRARELAVKERRERKQAKKAEAAAQRVAVANGQTAGTDSGMPAVDEHGETAAPVWIR